MPNWPTQVVTFMGVGTQCRRSLSPFHVGLLPPKIGCGLLVWCVWCGVCVQLVVAHNTAKCIGFPYGCWLWQKKPDAPAPRDKTRWKWKNTLFVESVCCMVPIACNLTDSAYGLNNLVNMQILTFHHTVWTQNCASDCNVEVKVVICVHKKLQILWKLGGPQSCKL